MHNVLSFTIRLALLLGMFTLSVAAEARKAEKNPPPSTNTFSPADVKKKKAAASGEGLKEECVTGEKVLLAEVEKNASLVANLKKFGGGVLYQEGKIFVRPLTGERKDPGACRGLIDTSIDLVKCEKYKPAGLSRMQVRDGVFEYLADGRYKDQPVAIPLKRLCSNGEGMAFDFLYNQKFSIVKVGPWDYAIRVTKEGDKYFTHIEATVVKTGEKVVLNKGPIEVGPLTVEEIKR